MTDLTELECAVAKAIKAEIHQQASEYTDYFQDDGDGIIIYDGSIDLEPVASAAIAEVYKHTNAPGERWIDASVHGSQYTVEIEATTGRVRHRSREFDDKSPWIDGPP